MNWIFDTYSNVYKTAMMQGQNTGHHVAPAKDHGITKRPSFFGLFTNR
jgi:hypothetical protein